MANQTPVVRQAGVVAVRNGQICLVSSRSGKRWVVPKGCIEPGKSAGEIARFRKPGEEAGLVGLLHGEPLGSYVDQKDGFICHVIVFMMTVTSVVEAYPKRHQRIWIAVPLVRIVESRMWGWPRSCGTTLKHGRVHRRQTKARVWRSRSLRFGFRFGLRCRVRRLAWRHVLRRLVQR